MADTSIKVDELVRDRLAQLAREQGTTMRELVAELTAARLTAEEVDARYERAHAYLTEHLCPALTEEDTAAGRWVWEELRSGRVPASLSPPASVQAQIRAEAGAAQPGTQRGRKSRRAG